MADRNIENKILRHHHVKAGVDYILSIAFVLAHFYVSPGQE